MEEQVLFASSRESGHLAALHRRYWAVPLQELYKYPKTPSPRDHDVVDRVMPDGPFFRMCFRETKSPGVKYVFFLIMEKTLRRSYSGLFEGFCRWYDDQSVNRGGSRSLAFSLGR